MGRGNVWRRAIGTQAVVEQILQGVGSGEGTKLILPLPSGKRPSRCF